MAIRDLGDELRMDPASLYREEVFTDRKLGGIRVLTPVKPDGSMDLGRTILYLGDAQIMTPAGVLPLSFEIDATSLADAVEKFAAAAEVGFEQALKQLQEMRREAASSIVIPNPGAGLIGPGGPGGLRGGGKIQLS
jgi:hypothetical protein